MRTSTRTLLAATAALALTAPLAACGAEEETPPESAPITTEDNTDATFDSTPAETDDAPAAEDPTGEGPTAGTSHGEDINDGVFPAIDLAESEAGGTAFEVDREDDRGGHWEVSVAVGGDEVDVDVSLDGTEVLGTDTDDDLDDDERAALERAEITLADAIRTALAEVNGVLDDVELDDERDTVAWEVSIDDDIEVYVDIVTGEVIRVERD